MKTLRFIVAGFGFMGQTHTASICRTPGMELAAVVDALDKEQIRVAGSLCADLDIGDFVFVIKQSI